MACGPSTATHTTPPGAAPTDTCGELSAEDAWLAEPAAADTAPRGSTLPVEVDVEVSVNPSVLRAQLTTSGLGVHGSVYDNSLHSAALPGELRTAGVHLIRWPGGGYSDNYHFATHSMSPFRGDPNNRGYLGPGTDFGSFVRVLDSFDGNAMITVNYGTNSDDNGPGEPKEAAAWVAYANGAVDDATVIGVDGTGHDWLDVAFWASLRAASPLAADDGFNKLRIGRAEPVGIHYWEVGNELFGNGYYSGQYYEEDLHVSPTGMRANNPALSPTTYGEGVVRYAAAMKAVDPSIAVGAVLNTPPADYGWGPSWNRDVMKAAGDAVDFVIVHWYPSGNVEKLLNTPRTVVPEIMKGLGRTLATCAPARKQSIEVAVTELGPNSSMPIPSNQSQALGLFALESYATLLEHGVVNVDWLELHDRSFISERNGTSTPGPAYHGVQLVHQLLEPGDHFVESSSSSPGAVSPHAALRADGSVTVLLSNLTSNTTAHVSVSIPEPALGTNAQRFDYAPNNGAVSGAVSGPSDVTAGNAFSVDLAPYSSVTLHIPPAP
ncbi:MAG: hypothetical protein QM756_19235 [Polyangiaceae bacterium]